MTQSIQMILVGLTVCLLVQSNVSNARQTLPASSLREAKSNRQLEETWGGASDTASDSASEDVWAGGNRTQEASSWGGGGGGGGGGGASQKSKKSSKSKPAPKPKHSPSKPKPKPKPKTKPKPSKPSSGWGGDSTTSTSEWGGGGDEIDVDEDEDEVTSNPNPSPPVPVPAPSPPRTPSPTSAGTIDAKSDDRQTCDCNDYSDSTCSNCIAGNGSCPDKDCANECCEVKTCVCSDYDTQTCKACLGNGNGSCPDEDCAEACCDSYEYTADGDSYKPKNNNKTDNNSNYSYNANGSSYKNKAWAAGSATSYLSSSVQFTFMALLVGSAAAAAVYAGVKSKRRSSPALDAEALAGYHHEDSEAHADDSSNYVRSV
jgi:hypothetical protein